MRDWPAAAALAISIIAIAPPLGAQTPDGFAPFAMDHRRAALASSPVDVSFLLDAPAGKSGFIRVDGGHLAAGDGKRIRFWGVNITDWSKGSRQVPSKQDAPMLAATLARFGVNCVRFQFLDFAAPRGLVDNASKGTRRLDADQLDREDFFVAEMEKRGIYIDFNLLVGRHFSEEDGVRDAALLRQGAKGTSLFDRRLIELQKEYARELIGHRNPYTQRAYAEDPGVAIVEINNENALNVGYRAPSPFYQQELEGMYNQWLAAHRSAEQVAQLRKIAGAAEGAPVPLMEWKGQAAQSPEERFHAEAEFYNDAQKSYFGEMEDYLKKGLGLKSLVIATADHSHANSGYPLLLATSAMDVVDGHTYWQHPEQYVRKSAMVNDPANSTPAELSRTAVAGKPYIVSEVNNPFPSDYDGEGMPILAAYGSLQDWDGIFWYTFEPKSDPAGKAYVGDAFDISLDPVKMPELAAGALMFLRADVAKARKTEERSYTEKQVFDSMLLPESERPYFTPGFPRDLALEHEVRIASLNGPATQSFSAEGVADPILSDTGQLAWFSSPRGTGMVSVDSARSQALIGFVKANGKGDSNFTAHVENGFCALLLSSLDGKPIAQASRMLLVAGGRVRNTGQRWNSAGTDVTSWGGAPTLIEQVRGSAALRGIADARAVQAQAIDGAGQPVGAAIDATKSADGWEIPLGGVTTTWYEITVRR